MKTKKYWFLVSVVGVSLVGIVTPSVHAGYILSYDKDSLAGIESFELELRVSAGEDSLGLKTKELEQQITRECGAFGVKVFSLSDFFNDPNIEDPSAKLLVTISECWPLDVPFRDKYYSYSIRIFVLQYVRLTRDLEKTFQAITWENSYTWFCKEQIFVTEVTDKLHHQIDWFIKGYLEANQKPKNKK